MYKFFRLTHKWTGIILAVVLLNIAVSGFLLIVKKDFDWIQPPTQKSEGGSVAQFITIEKLYEIVLSQDHPDFKLPTDIDRIDVRPGKAIYKVKSEHNYSEIQVDAVSGKVLSRATRNSDLIEKLHDGSFYGNWVHDWLM
ncbi:PepSY domain-containing protein, partial [bacterium]|nr:PepSY domain-containing protein [bacterium]